MVAALAFCASRSLIFCSASCSLVFRASSSEEVFGIGVELGFWTAFGFPV